MAADEASTLKQALHALYHHPDDGVRTAADTWLEEFQGRIEAWQISNDLLHDSGSSLEVQYFCAQTLRTKVQRDFEELPEGSAESLRDSLLTLLIKFRQGPPAVCTQLCIALASIAAHAQSSQWGDGGGIVRWLASQLGSHQDARNGLIELLAVLPQESASSKVAVRPERRRQFSAEIDAAVPDALSLLAACWVEGSYPVQNRILQAFASWLRFSYAMPSTSLVSNPLVVAALEGLNKPETFDSSVEAVCELLRLTVAGEGLDLEPRMPLIEVLISHVMGLRPRFSAALKVAAAEQQGITTDVESAEDDDTCKGMARIFEEMGEAYVDLIAQGYGQAMPIAEVIAEVASHPDFEIASISFNFWHILSRRLTQRPAWEEEVPEVAKGRVQRLELFKPLFEVLVSLVSFRVRYPANYQSWRKDELHDFKQTRYAVADVLTDVAAVLGGERILLILAQPLFELVQSALAGGSWEVVTVEACLYCIRGIAADVPRTENQILPQIMMLLPKLPHEPRLLYTASMCVAAYVDWLAEFKEAHKELPNLLSLLTSALAASEESPPAAALALKHLCDACRQHLADSLDTLLMVYNKVLTAGGALHLDTEDELQVVEGLSFVVSALPLEKVPAALQALCVPIVNPLQAVVAAGAQAAQTGQMSMPSGKDYIVHIDRLANVFRNCSQPQPLADLFGSLWPLLKAIFDQRGYDNKVMERLCRACKYAIRSGKAAMTSVLGPLLGEVQTHFRLHRHACLLYVASEVVKTFGHQPAIAQALGLLLQELFLQTVALLQDSKAFTEYPDVADDCFLLANRCIRYCPLLLVGSDQLAPLLDCAMIGLTVQHREACSSVLAFWKDVITLTLSQEEGSPMRNVIQTAVGVRGAALVRILFACATGALPEWRVIEISDLLGLLARVDAKVSLQWVHEGASMLPASAISESERMSLLQAMANAASWKGSSDLLRSLEDISGACRRNKRVLEAVQAALQPQQLVL